MIKTFKKLITLLIISGLGYLGLKIYQLLKGLIELDKTLPQYLGNIIGEVPTVSITAVFNRITIAIKYGEEIIKKNEGLENIARDYVTDFYPIFKADNVKVLIEELKEEKEKSATQEKK
ncbi:MAG: hypothetical protein PF570_04965 [Candidatus Cloacimonetes bacterium]|jgi:hypothetical protein|nr:hypothetical protein [Candidatus Cloacimonadota bacterium]